jgi:hypothetical protein
LYNDVAYPLPIEFDWKAVNGLDVQQGRGLLARNLHPLRDKLTEFTVAIGNLIVSVFPQRGEMTVDHHPIFKCECGQPHKVIWFRRMHLELSNGGRNTTPARCQFYGFGLECSEGKRGFRFMEDGRVVKGLD